MYAPSNEMACIGFENGMKMIHFVYSLINFISKPKICFVPISYYIFMTKPFSTLFQTDYAWFENVPPGLDCTVENIPR